MRKIITAFMMLLCAVCMASAANCLTFTAEEDSSTFGIVNKTNSPDVQYSIDGGTSWTALSGGEMVTLAHKGDKALLRGNNPEGFSKEAYSKYSSFTMTGKIAASGSVMSLIDGMGKTLVVPAGDCFCRLFEGCTSLTQAPELPATTLAEYCYLCMFNGCTSLTQAPELPATTLDRVCYAGMFQDCTSLTQAPELPATSLSNNCYNLMFRGCTSLTQAPELPATTLADGCYYFMFEGCTNLSEISVAFEEWSNIAYTQEWVANVAPTGTFYCPKALPLEYGVSRIPEGWTVKYIEVMANYLTFTAEEDGSSFGIVNNGYNYPDLQYSLDGGETWNALAAGDTITLAHKGDKALLRGDNPEGFSKGHGVYSSFTMTGKIAASGSVMSLNDGVGISTEVPVNFCFYKLFQGCTSLTQAPELPATILKDDCYADMFSGCTSLTEVPELPATALIDNCYNSMFKNCTGLTRAYLLFVDMSLNVRLRCLSEMFSGCTNLSEIRVAFDEWSGYTQYWVYNVAPTGTFYCPKALPLEYGVSRIPEGWTVKYIDDTVAAETNYLTFTAEEDGSTFGIVNNGENNPDIQYSLDGGETWNALAAGDTITLAHKGDKALLRGNNPEGFSKDWRQCSAFKMTGKVAASGSVMSLIDGVGISTEVPGNLCFYKLFQGCTSLTQAPALPATTLADFCYAEMFSGCTSLTQAPELPATTLAEGCYFGMFSSCTSLTQAPELPATTLPTTSNVENGCYSSMFEFCTSLTQAPELPATTLAEGCYAGMFYACTSLTQAPKLPATTLADFCYIDMFSGCTSLTQAPELPATTLTDFCYDRMFFGCTSLTQAPELPAKEFLGKYSYSGMFSGCTNLSKINVSFATWSDYYSNTDGWVKDVAPTGTFICPKALPLEYGVSRIPEGWTVKYIDDTVAAETNYLTFTAEEDGSTFGIACNYLTPDVQYSLNGGETWTELAVGDTILLAKKGDKALIRGYNEGGLESSRKDYVHFVMTGTIVANGSVMSLIDGVGLSTKIPCRECFCNLFENCTSLTQAPELPATTLAVGCYSEMFSGCTSLTQAPELPATEMTFYCYNGMFSGCTSLTKAPELPATTLAEDCYAHMFKGCTSLTEAPELPATTLAEYCYLGMFRGCTSLTQAPELPATTLAGGCYSSMFSGCTSLIRAPQISALTMDFRDCIAAMFSGCTNLSEISVAFEEWSNIAYTQEWVANVAPTGTFYCPKALPLEYGVSRIPEGWTVKYIEDMANYLTFTAEEDSSSFGIVNNGDNNPDVQYSLDGGATWIALSGGKMVTLAHKGDKALLKGNNPQGFSKSSSQYSSFKMTGKVAASGSVMSLIDGMGISTEIPNSHCFFVLFEYCRGLTQAPELPATTLTELCYWYMFRNCTSLKQAPELPAMTLANKCYCFMFSGCTSLTQAPALPATTLAPYCYRNMFSGCKGLTQAPELPATTLAESCYYYMFEDCTSLTRAPHLPATTLADYCYMGMFSGCTSLSQISVSFDDWGGNRGTAGWVIDVAPTGTFICPSALAQRYGEDRIPVGWTLEYNRIDPNYLTFTAEEDGSSFGIVNINNNNNPDVQYSLDGGKTWTALAGGEMVTLAHKGDKALLRGDNPEGFSKSRDQYSTFRMTGKVAASGSVMSLIDGVGISTEVPGNFCFYKLFQGCTSLTQAPELPATILADNCYWGMFRGCTSLTQAPELPATTLAEGCYYEMFLGCTSLSEIKVPFDDWNRGDYTAEWVIDVAPTGTFICPKTLPLEYGWESIPEGWTVKYIEDMANYLTFTAEEDGSTFGIVNNAGNNPDLQYSLDGGKTWTALAGGDSVLLAHKGDKALLKGDNPQGFSKSFYQPTFKMTGKVAASGSVMSLICGTGLSTEILGNSCFVNLFKDCTSLTQAPELPATILTEYCYDGMFSGCTSLTQAPELPATTLDYVCYANMFNGCTGLTQAPKLPATTLLEGCYMDMFSGCTSLSEINVSFEDWDYGMGTGFWVTNVAPTGTFICPKPLPLEYGESRIPEGWTVKYIDDTVAVEPNYLTFTAEEDGSTFGIVNEGNNPDVQYSLDGGETWNALAAGDAITLAHKGDKALLRGDNPEGISKGYSECSSFTMTGKIAASGSVMSLIDGTGLSTEIPNEYCFCRSFRACTSLTRAPELPATTLAEYCYCEMFSGCTSLTQAPELPATTLASCCYEFMFSGCTSLTQAPALPATTLAESCYDGMFSGCTSLSQAPELPATTLAPTCYCEMFSGCTSLTQAPELPATTLVEGCYYGMFKGCTSLTEAPELPATTLADYCYSSMFYGCTNLSQIDVAFEEWPINEGTYNYVANVAPTGTFICPKALALEYGEDRIPEGWTVKYVDEGSGVSSALADGVTVWTDDLTIFVRGAEGEVSLYDMSGRIVATSNSKDEERALCVPSKGVYVVRTSGGERSVLVR